jgi:hypothetical protein
MNCKIIKISLIFVGLVMFLGLLGNEHSPLTALFDGRNLQTYSSPLAYLFQLMFILFFISPPIIAFLLFMIWKELKERNRMK